MHILIALAVALALGGGVTFAANGAQEGDALYGVKANVNDRVEAAVEPLVTEFRAVFNTDAEADADAKAEGSAHASSTTEVKSKTDASVDVNASGNVDIDL